MADIVTNNIGEQYRYDPDLGWRIVGNPAPNADPAAIDAPASTPVPTIKPATQDYGIRLPGAPPAANQLTRGGALDPLSTIEKYESGGRNVPNYRYDSTHTAQGYWQITNSTWRDVAPRVGVDLSVYPTAMDAPKEVQRAVAGRLFSERGYQPWAPYNPALAKAVGYQTGLHMPTGALGGNLDYVGVSAPVFAPKNELAAEPSSLSPVAQPLANPLAMLALLAAGTHTFVPVKYDPFVGVTQPAKPVPIVAASSVAETPYIAPSVAKTAITLAAKQFNQGLRA